MSNIWAAVWEVKSAVGPWCERRQLVRAANLGADCLALDDPGPPSTLGMVTSVPTRADIEAAADLIRPFVRRTPVMDYEVAPGLTVTLKLELLQHAGSFKPRGAFTTVLSQPEQPQRLVAASGGNHGLAVAHVGRALSI